MAGRWLINGDANQNVAVGKYSRAFYNSTHEVEVVDVNIDKGTLSVNFINGGGEGEPATLPMLGASAPRAFNGNMDVAKMAWGLYIPQKGDRVYINFDVRGNAYTVGYANSLYGAFDKWDKALVDKGGIGWGSTSGKYLKPGDWSFKSSRNSSLYIGDRFSITSGTFSLNIDYPNGVFREKADLFLKDFGTNSQCRVGNIRRILVDGVDTQESGIIDSTTGFPGQEYSIYARRPSLVFPTGILAVRSSIGDVLDEVSKILPSAPGLFAKSLVSVLPGTATRSLLAILDDATGTVPMFTEVVDNLGNYGVEALTATGVGWSTPAAKWMVLNKDTEWTSSLTMKLTVGTKFETLVGAEYSVVSVAKMDLTSGAALTLKAPSISLASGSISLGASPCVLTCSDALSFAAPSITLGSGAAEPVVKATTYNAAMNTFLTVLIAQWGALASACGVPPLTALAAPFSAMAAAAGVMSGSLSGVSTTITKAV
jgi:hypothetical protein